MQIERSRDKFPYKNLLVPSKFLMVSSSGVESVGRDFSLNLMVLLGLHFDDNTLVPEFSATPGATLTNKHKCSIIGLNWSLLTKIL